MAKQRKKRKYTRRKGIEQISANVNERTIPQGQTESNIPTRANEKAYVLAPQGSKVFIRNLSDEALLINYSNNRKRIRDVQDELQFLQNSNWQLTKEKEFREL